MNMKFVNRSQELNELRQIEQLAQKKRFVAALYGLRRVGKTRLLLEFIQKKGVYFFVNKNKTSQDLLNEFEAILKDKKILTDLETLRTWEDFFETIAQRTTLPIVLDEFQNFAFVEPAVFGMLQKTIDLNEEKPGLIILCGSQIGLMKKLFQNSKEPLYGRIKKKIRLQPLGLPDCFQFTDELNMDKETAVKTYLLFGGYPKYFVTIEDFGLQGKTAEEIVDALFLAKNAPLEDEVIGILSQEFGGRSGTYYSILEAIANGNNTLSSIAGYLNTPATSITRQIQELKEQFDLIRLEMPYAGKRGQYRINHPVMDFWFSQVYRNYSDYVARKPEFTNQLRQNLNAYFGRRFELAARQFLIGKLGLTHANAQWGRTPSEPKGRNAYEIDLVGNNQGAATYAFEFKWDELNAQKALGVVQRLRDKAAYVPLPPDATFGIVAKRLHGKKILQEKGILAYDLNDLEKRLPDAQIMPA